MRPSHDRSSASSPVIVVADREPYRHYRDQHGQLIAARSSSGVVNAVEPLLLSRGGVWIAEGIGDADRDAARQGDGLEVPPGSRGYRLRRVWLDPLVRRGFYDGFANSALWPLCHRTHVEPTFYATDFQAYELVNRRFADVVREEANGSAPVVLVQDYHFALVPGLVRRQLPLSRIATFWHIPWPRPETFSICPWSRSLLEGLLGSNNVGLQTATDRDRFLDSVQTVLGSTVDRAGGFVMHEGRRVSVGVFPASIPWPDRPPAAVRSVSDCRRAVRNELGLNDASLLGVGVDRLDYTKGIEQKFLAIERLLERHSSLVGRFVLVQVAEPTREDLEVYRRTRSRILETADRVNRRFPDVSGAPIRILEAHHSREAVFTFLRAADCCFVNSLHDGMNLVAKEFVSARDDEQGALVLSAFAGAARELTDAVLVNPYDIDGTADALARALTMESAEQRDRMQRLRAVVRRADARRWATAVLASVADEEAEINLPPAAACGAFAS